MKILHTITILAICNIALSSFLSDNNHQLEKLNVLFEKFINEYNKVYNSIQEKEKRFEIFIENVIENLPELLTSNEHKFSPYLDLTKKEFADRYLSKVKIGKRDDIKVFQPSTFGDDTISFDWRDHNAVTPVKNQGSCGSCWAFSAVGNIESQHLIKRGGSPVQYSEQQLVDCDKGGESDGCAGGDMLDAYRYLKRVGGIEKQINYPYTGKDGKCKFSSLLASETVSDLFQIERDEEIIKKALVEVGPLSVAMDASSLQFYTKGSIIRQNSKCGQKESDLNHGVLIVAFGELKENGNGLKYWEVKNSWGTKFGDDGFFKIERGTNACGISLDVSSSVLK